MAFVIGTMVTLGVTLIVAMVMENTCVAQFFSAAEAFGGDVVYLNHVSILKEQSAPAAFSFLFLEELPQCSAKHVVLAESLPPIQQISIIGGRLTFHFDVPLDMREAVCPQL
jgi:hypothetical protein